MPTDSPPLSHRSRAGGGVHGGGSGAGGGALSRMSASGSQGGNGMTPRISSISTGNTVHGQSPLVVNTQLRSVISSSRLGRSSASGVRVSNSGSSTGSIGNTGTAGPVAIASRMIQPRASMMGGSMLSRLGGPRTSMMGGIGSMSMRNATFQAEEELDEIISSDMRAAVRKTLAMNKMMAEHTANMKKYYSQRRKQQALTSALKTRGLDPKTPTGGSALTAEFLMATSPSALPELMSPSMAGQVGALVAAAHHLQTDGSLADVQFQPPSPAPILRLPQRLQRDGPDGSMTSRGGHVKFATHRSTHRATHRSVAPRHGDEDDSAQDQQRGGSGDGAQEQDGALTGRSGADRGYVVDGDEALDDDEDDEADYDAVYDDEPGPDDLVWGDEDDAQGEGDADAEGLWDTPLLHPLPHLGGPSLFLPHSPAPGDAAAAAAAVGAGAAAQHPHGGAPRKHSQPSLEVHLPIPAEDSFDSERSLTPSQVIKYVPGELLKHNADALPRHAKLQAQHAQAQQHGTSYGVPAWAEPSIRGAPLDIAVLDATRRRALQDSPQPPPGAQASQASLGVPYDKAATASTALPTQQQPQLDYEDPDRPVRYAPLSIHVLGCMAAKAKGLHRVAQVRGSSGSPPRSATMASQGRAPSPGRREALPWCTPITGSAPPPPSMCASPVPHTGPEPAYRQQPPPPPQQQQQQHRHPAASPPPQVPALNLSKHWLGASGQNWPEQQQQHLHSHPHSQGGPPNAPPRMFTSPEPQPLFPYVHAPPSTASIITNLSLTYLAGDRVPRAGSKPGLPPEARSLIAAGRRGAPGTAPARMTASSDFPGPPSWQPFHSPHDHRQQTQQHHEHRQQHPSRQQGGSPVPFAKALSMAQQPNHSLSFGKVPPRAFGDILSDHHNHVPGTSHSPSLLPPSLPAAFRPRLVNARSSSSMAAAY